MDSVKINAELAKWKVNKAGLMPVVIRIDLKGSRVATEFLPIRIRQDDWNDTERRVNKAVRDSVYMNQVITTKLQRYSTYLLKRQAFNLPVTANLLKSLVKNGSAEVFCEYADRVLDTKTLKDGQGYDPETKRRYRDEMKRIEVFAPAVTFQQITPEWLTKYKVWQQTTYLKKDGSRLTANGIWNAFKFMRMVLNEAVRDQLILEEQNPFKSWKVDSYETNIASIKYLELADLLVIETTLTKKNLPALTLAIGWRFLAMCLCGMRISDAMLLGDASFNQSGDLEFRPHKTRRHGNTAVVPIVSDRQRSYLQQAMAHQLPETNAKSFRTTFNNHLKVIGAAAGLSVNLTSHVGRHTMGSFLVDAGVDKKAAMAILGVKSEDVIDTYLHLKQSKLQSEALKLRNVF